MLVAWQRNKKRNRNGLAWVCARIALPVLRCAGYQPKA
jgi:hypothetical protein